MELVNRFPFPRLHSEVRWLLLNVPAKAVHEPEALPILLQDRLPSDVNFLQLKVRLFARVSAGLDFPRIDCSTAYTTNSTCFTGHR